MRLVSQRQNPNSNRLGFTLTGVTPGAYRYDIGTAGAGYGTALSGLRNCIGS